MYLSNACSNDDILNLDLMHIHSYGTCCFLIPPFSNYLYKCKTLQYLKGIDPPLSVNAYDEWMNINRPHSFKDDRLGTYIKVEDDRLDETDYVTLLQFASVSVYIFQASWRCVGLNEKTPMLEDANMRKNVQS